MVMKWSVHCGNCNKTIGFKIDTCPMQSVFCYSCEAVVTSEEETREAEMALYRASANRS
jgi:hypothetical protein